MFTSVMPSGADAEPERTHESQTGDHPRQNSVITLFLYPLSRNPAVNSRPIESAAADGDGRETGPDSRSNEGC
jgi:hypothetical protein